MKRVSVWSGAVSAIAASSLLVAACGGGAAPTGTSPGGSTAETKSQTTTGTQPGASPAAKSQAAQPAGSPAAAQGKPATGDPIKIGELVDLSGPTSPTVIPMHQARLDYFNYVTQNGGVKGRPLELVTIDDKYQIPLSVEGFKRLTSSDNVQAVFFSSTGNTEATVGQVKSLKLPSVTSSGAEAWGNPQENPYHFQTLTPYGMQARLAMKWINDSWKDTSRKPKVGYAYPDNPFGKAALEDAKKAAQQYGFEWVGEWVVPLDALDTTTQVLNMRERGVDWVFHQNVGGPASVLFRDAKKAGLNTQFVGTSYATDEVFLKSGGADVEGAYGVHPYAFPYMDTPGTNLMKDIARQRGGNPEDLAVNSIEGWLESTAMVEAMKRGDSLEGDAVIKGLEQIQNLETGGLSQPMSFSSSNHSGTHAVRVYQVKDGRWTPITDYITE